jgi:hypothetical protein
MSEIDLNPVCSKELIYLPLSFFGFMIAVTIMPKDKDNLYAKVDTPFKTIAGDLPKEKIRPILRALNKLCKE